MRYIFKKVVINRTNMKLNLTKKDRFNISKKDMANTGKNRELRIDNAG